MFAAQPIIVERKLVHYIFYCLDARDNPFLVGHQAVVTTDNHGYNGDGHAVFGIVRQMTDEITNSSWPRNRVTMLIEVHTIPGFYINWHKTIPWPVTPFHTIFIQPHVFCEDRYEPLSIVLVERNLPTVYFCLSDLHQYQAHAPHINMAPLSLPSSLVYPQHGTSYLFQLATRGNIDLELNDDMVDEILSIRAQNGSVPPSPTIIADDLSVAEIETIENEDDDEDEGEETEYEFKGSELET